MENKKTVALDTIREYGIEQFICGGLILGFIKTREEGIKDVRTIIRRLEKMERYEDCQYLLEEMNRYIEQNKLTDC